MYEPGCGLDNVLLTWTGPEYVYSMLKHNGVSLPDAGFAMLRLFSLFDWHGKNDYGHLTNVDDEDVQNFVADFDDMRRAATIAAIYQPEMSDDECELLWKTHYVNVVTKYGADGVLRL